VAPGMRSAKFALTWGIRTSHGAGRDSVGPERNINSSARNVDTSSIPSGRRQPKGPPCLALHFIPRPHSLVHRLLESCTDALEKDGLSARKRSTSDLCPHKSERYPVIRKCLAQARSMGCCNARFDAIEVRAGFSRPNQIEARRPA
jgi:hypothetical protein